MADCAVMLTGASGLLGTWLLRTAPSAREIVAVVHRRKLRGTPSVEVDLRDARAVEAATRQVRPSLVVHAAYAKDRASIVDATQHVVDAATDVGAAIIFISTDAVFSGDGERRAERDPPEPISDYGRWKADAERTVTASPAESCVVRLPLIVSLAPDDHVVERIRTHAARGETTRWFSDELRQPARGQELAEAVWRIASLSTADRSGTWHLPGPESLSRYEIAQRVVATLGLDPRAVVAELTPPDADRPRHLDLSDDRAKRNIGWSPSPVLS